MSEHQLSWRRQPAPSPNPLQHGSQASKSNFFNQSKGDARFASSWRNKGALNGNHQQRSSHFRSGSVNESDVGSERGHKSMMSSNIVTSNVEMDKGPAVPLVPLYMSHNRPLPHPSTYNGVDNWAMTPTSSIPSLPATPSRAMQALGWAHNTTLLEDEHPRESIGSRGLSAARANLNRRNEDNRILSPYFSNTAVRQSPKRQSNHLASSPAIRDPINAGSMQPTRIIPPYDSNPYSSPSPRPTPLLRNKDSSLSLASSSIHSLGTHPLSHSRRTSQIFLNSPASSVLSPSLADRPGYRVYRPPHLRRKDSIHALKPKISHYDRVRTPSLRGQSRSPDAGSLLGWKSQDGSGTPSDSASVTSSSRPPGVRRLSSLGTYNTSLYDDSTMNNTRGTLDSRSLYTKLASSKLRKASDASNFSTMGYDAEDEENSRYEKEDDEVDLLAEDLMMETRSLTDEFCMSRMGSSESNRPVVDIFQIGDRLGPGMMHDGLEVTIAETTEGFKDQNADLTGSQLEVMKKLGEGSYAVVYLVKEVFRRQRGESEEDKMQIGAVGIPRSDTVKEVGDCGSGDETLIANSIDVYGTTLKANSDGRLLHQEVEEEEGEKDRYFALKCLCKRDLSDEMLQVQRLEATIHQSIPRHPHIVTLHRTYETTEWLFLILEYCPGQDLFYWLEQAHDTNNLEMETPLVERFQITNIEKGYNQTDIDSTPPSPSLLASTESRFLLSSRRLRLISRMFQQICQAIEFCHARGISHRDIKPENFIVEDTRETASHDSVIVKLTDFGLAVAQDQCIDFDCGSKPYMSYECRNNKTKWYDPKQSDIWSLGIVLLNLIFHRNPWSEPQAENCLSFATYTEDSVRFLYTAFQGIKWEAAEYLAGNVFCNVDAELDLPTRRKRVSAEEFGNWASDLSKHMEMPLVANQSFEADEEYKSSLAPTRDTSSSESNLALLSSNPSIHQELASMEASEEDENIESVVYRDDETLGESDECLQIPTSDITDARLGLLDDSERNTSEKEKLTRHSPATTLSGNPKRRKRGARKGRTMTKQELKRSQSVGHLVSTPDTNTVDRDDILRDLAEASQTLAREMSKGVKSLPLDSAAIPMTSDLIPSRSSLASTQYTNFDWPEITNPSMPSSLHLSNLSKSNIGKERFSALPAPPVMSNWRAKDSSTASIKSGSLYSDVASIHSTVSAPAAFSSTSRRQNFVNSQSSSSSSLSASALSASKLINGRNALSSPTNLDTISEKISDKKLDASYLAEIFGGRVSLDGRSKKEDTILLHRQKNLNVKKDATLVETLNKAKGNDKLDSNGSKAANETQYGVFKHFGKEKMEAPLRFSGKGDDDDDDDDVYATRLASPHKQLPLWKR